ncbi:MAG: aspartate aminotransferase family protein [Gammaproteobacteria bacterium]|nr:aspartate aminotransferase family protein [Gammaproteobacteria bacterium]
MDLEDFRRNGHAAVDWVVEYLRNVESYPVLSRVKPGDIRARLPAHPPERGDGFDAMLRDVNEIVLPGITHWQSPNFFAFFPGNSSPPAILGEILSAGLAVQGMLWATSPACTEVESHMLDWLVEMLGLPDRFNSRGKGGGVIQDSASSATLSALLAARERASGGRSNRSGCNGRLVAYTSAQAHSSIEKDCMVAGIGSEKLRLIEVDDRYAMRPEKLAAQIEKDKSAGLMPFFVCAFVGTTSSLALDPVRRIGEICQEHGLWLHVDAAMAGTAAVCPEFRYINDGAELAQSYVFNPHKWMFTNFDCSAFFVSDRKALINAMSVAPEYLRNQASEAGAVIDYRDWHVPLGRRFRALKLWFVIRHYGMDGLRFHIRRHVELAQRFKEWVRESEKFELAVDCPLNLICFRHRGGDEVTQKVLDRANASGRLYLTHTRLDGRLTLRLCVGQTRTEARHVEQAWEEIKRAG